MKKSIITACLYTLVTAVGLGIIYPLVVTGLAQLLFHDNANGQLIVENGQIIGSRIIGQPFTGPGFFHSRPSAAGSGYDAAVSSGSNLAPTNKALVDRVNSATRAEGSNSVPVDLVTASASGLDPDITPAAALYQVDRIARERRISEVSVRTLVIEHIQQRQLGLLGEPRVNVFELNRALLGQQSGH
jgi:K+-transporting ATPase ATPase C chain